MQTNTHLGRQETKAFEELMSLTGLTSYALSKACIRKELRAQGLFSGPESNGERALAKALEDVEED